MKKFLSVGTIIGCLAGVALAHDGVQNAAVMARMQVMSEIGAASKVMGQMARGLVDFDAKAAQAAAAQIARRAAEVPGLFEAREDDPKSEARAEIWDNFADFTAKSTAMEKAAQGALEIASLDDLRAAMAGIGGSCKACHKSYRE